MRVSAIELRGLASEFITRTLALSERRDFHFSKCEKIQRFIYVLLLAQLLCCEWSDIEERLFVRLLCR